MQLTTPSPEFLSTPDTRKTKVNEKFIYQRLLRSVSTSIIDMGVSLQSESSTGELEDSAAEPPSFWKVLNANCGPIHRRLCGPA
jgi:hypothetical protein